MGDLIKERKKGELQTKRSICGEGSKEGPTEKKTSVGEEKGEKA